MASEWRGPLALSLIVHALVLIALFVGIRDSTPPAAPQAPPRPIIQASAVDETKVMAEMERRRDEESRVKREAEDKRRREQEVKRQAEVKRKKEAEKKRLAEKKRKEAEEKKRKEAEEKKRKEKERVEAEKRRLAEEEKQRKISEEARRKKVEEELRAKLAAEMEAEEQRIFDEQRRARLDSLGRQYAADIRNKVRRNWLLPSGSRAVDGCKVLINQLPSGDVMSVRVTSCSGDAAYQRSIEAAVRKASPLPLAPDPELFDREIEFTFSPR